MCSDFSSFYRWMPDTILWMEKPRNLRSLQRNERCRNKGIVLKMISCYWALTAFSNDTAHLDVKPVKQHRSVYYYLDMVRKEGQVTSLARKESATRDLFNHIQSARVIKLSHRWRWKVDFRPEIQYSWVDGFGEILRSQYHVVVVVSGKK